MAHPLAAVGTQEKLIAIYDKLGDSGSSSGKIDEKLDTIISLTSDVNNNIQINTEAIKENTQAIKDISINVDVKYDSNEIIDKIDNVNHSVSILNSNVNSGFDRTINAINQKQIQPVPHHHRHHYHPDPRPFIPNPIYDDCRHCLPNRNYFHNPYIQSNQNLTIEQKTYLEQVDRDERKFNPDEYYSLPSYVHCSATRDMYNEMIYRF